MSGEFAFTEDRPGEPLTLERAVAEAFGYASMCWSERPQGVFDSVRAGAAVDALVARIREGLPDPQRNIPSRWRPVDRAGAILSGGMWAGETEGTLYVRPAQGELPPEVMFEPLPPVDGEAFTTARESVPVEAGPDEDFRRA